MHKKEKLLDFKELPKIHKMNKIRKNLQRQGTPLKGKNNLNDKVQKMQTEREIMVKK